MSEQALRCGWCDTLLRPGTQPETTGVCKPCAGEVEARTWQPRYAREIAEAVGRAELAGKPDEQRQAWASAQNLSRQQASAQIQADFDEMTDGTTTSMKVDWFIPLDPAPYAYRDPDVWYRRVGVAMCVVSAAFVAYLGWQVVRWIL